MQRRSFVASLFAGLATIPFNPIKAFAKPKVEPFWDWTCKLRLNAGKTITHIVHTTPKLGPLPEITYDGKHFSLVSSDLLKRRSVYKEAVTLDDLASKGWQAYTKRAERALASHVDF